jgi:hypothetical protein
MTVAHAHRPQHHLWCVSYRARVWVYVMLYRDIRIPNSWVLAILAAPLVISTGKSRVHTLSREGTRCSRPGCPGWCPRWCRPEWWCRPESTHQNAGASFLSPLFWVLRPVARFPLCGRANPKRQYGWCHNSAYASDRATSRALSLRPSLAPSKRTCQV